MSNWLTHGYFVVDWVCCANNCNQKWTVLVPRIPISAKCKLHIVDWRQNVDCRLQSGYKMQTENLKSFFCLVCENMSSYNSTSVTQLLFCDYLHYCGIFLAHFRMKIDHNIISSLHIVFSLCVQVGWCDVCTDFTNIIKVEVDVNKLLLLNI